MAEKRTTTKDLRALPATDLRDQLDKLRHELWRHKAGTTDGSLKQTHLLPKARRQIARLETLLRERS